LIAFVRFAIVQSDHPISGSPQSDCGELLYRAAASEGGEPCNLLIILALLVLAAIEHLVGFHDAAVTATNGRIAIPHTRVLIANAPNSLGRHAEGTLLARREGTLPGCPSSCAPSRLEEGAVDMEHVDEGVDAYCIGTPRHGCPYEPGTQEHHDWLRGWDEAEEVDFEERKNAG
jgi:ribosome modulation factor